MCCSTTQRIGCFAAFEESEDAEGAPCPCPGGHRPCCRSTELAHTLRNGLDRAPRQTHAQPPASAPMNLRPTRSDVAAGRRPPKRSSLQVLPAGVDPHQPNRLLPGSWHLHRRRGGTGRAERVPGKELRQTTLLGEPGLDGRVCPGRAARQCARPVPRPGARPRSATRARSVHFVYRHRHTLGCTPYTYPVAVQRPSTAADDLSSGRPRCVRGRLNEAHRPTVDISSSVLAPLGAAKMLPVCLRS
jgi:hypothetical protein